MRILVAEDDLPQREALQALLGAWGYDVIAVADGLEAHRVLGGPEAPALALLDSRMPGMDGPSVCRRMRRDRPEQPVHLILLTVSTAPEEVERGLEAGADDYVGKPFHEAELRARIRAGLRLVAFRLELADRVRDLEAALDRVKKLEGILPICGYCKKIRDDGGAWEQLESYISRRSEARFSHGICPDCYTRIVEPQV
jgi:DNA-binding response OmpR family regulator